MEKNTGLSRRFMLGSLGAAALSAIALPFKAKADDIVIGTEMPPLPVRVERKAAPIPEIEQDGCLYDKHGNAVAVISNFDISCRTIDVTSWDTSGFNERIRGLMEGTITARIINPAAFKIGQDKRYQFNGPNVKTTWTD